MSYQAVISNLEKYLSKRWVRIIFGWVVPLTVLVVIYFRFNEQSSSCKLLDALHLDYSLLLLTVFLLPVNLLIEAYKWKLLCDEFEQKSFFEHLKIILAGKSANVITPFGIGDASTRILMNKSKTRFKTLLSLVTAMLTQSIPTYLFGFVTVWFLVDKGVELFDFDMLDLMLGASLMILIMLLLIWFYGGDLNKAFRRLRYVNEGLFSRVLILSFIRYSIFSLQFYLTFRSIGFSMEVQYLFLGIFWIFLFKSALPNISIVGDLVKRELSSILYFSLFDVDLGLVALANLIIWTINMVLPSLIGSMFLSKFITQR